MNSDGPKFDIIHQVVANFYQTAINDIWIGYHFQRIDNLDKHIERISYFWQLQLTGKITRPEFLPFLVIEVHRPLKITTGQVDRWIILFHQTLDRFNKELNADQIELWKSKIELFRDRLKIIAAP